MERGPGPAFSVLVSVSGTQLAFSSCRLLGGQVQKGGTQNGAGQSEAELPTVSRGQEPPSTKLETKDQL